MLNHCLKQTSKQINTHTKKKRIKVFKYHDSNMKFPKTRKNETEKMLLVYFYNLH